MQRWGAGSLAKRFQELSWAQRRWLWAMHQEYEVPDQQKADVTETFADEEFDQEAGAGALDLDDNRKWTDA